MLDGNEPWHRAPPQDDLSCKSDQVTPCLQHFKLIIKSISCSSSAADNNGGGLTGRQELCWSFETSVYPASLIHSLVHPFNGLKPGTVPGVLPTLNTSIFTTLLWDCSNSQFPKGETELQRGLALEHAGEALGNSPAAVPSSLPRAKALRRKQSLGWCERAFPQHRARLPSVRGRCVRCWDR